MVEIHWFDFGYVIVGRLIVGITLIYFAVHSGTCAYAATWKAIESYRGDNWVAGVSRTRKIMASLWDGCKLFRRQWLA